MNQKTNDLFCLATGIFFHSSSSGTWEPRCTAGEQSGEMCHSEVRWVKGELLCACAQPNCSLYLEHIHCCCQPEQLGQGHLFHWPYRTLVRGNRLNYVRPWFHFSVFLPQHDSAFFSSKKISTDPHCCRDAVIRMLSLNRHSTASPLLSSSLPPWILVNS